MPPRPVLRLLHPDRLPLTWEDATVMSWGGLRGAVGLALAMQVRLFLFLGFSDCIPKVLIGFAFASAWF